METSGIAKWIFGIGLGLIVIAGIIWLGGKIGLPLGKMPGDIHIEKGKTSVYFPIVTSIVVSILLTIIFNFILWLTRK